MAEVSEVDWEPVKFSKYIYDAKGRPKQIVWDVSSLDNLLRCGKYYDYGNLKGMRLALPPSATYFGHAVHHGFEILEEAKFHGKSKEEAVEEAVLEIIKEYGEGLRQSTDTARTLASTLRAIVWRGEEYWDDPLEVVAMPDGKPAVEVRFEAPLDFVDGPFRLSGRIDKIVQHNDDLYLVDIKTTKKVTNSYFFDGFMPSTQVYGYLWVAREILGLPVRGFVIDAVQTLVESTRFGRSTFDVSEDQIREWKTMVGGALNELERSDGVFAHNYASCGNFGGCTYRQICAQPEFLRQTYIDDSYTSTIHPSLTEADDADGET
jgi:hypothetical protein